jgi:hypothetical protein
MILTIEIAFGVLLGWILIQGVRRITRIPQERVDKAKAKIEAMIAEAVEKGDTCALQVFEATYEAESRKIDMGGYKPDFTMAMREAEKRKRQRLG